MCSSDLPDIITAPGPGGRAIRQTNHLKVFDGVTGAQVTDAFVNPIPFGEKYARGYNLVAGDFTGDGKVDLAVAPRGGLPTVVIIDGATHTARPAMTVLPTTLPYRSGVRIAAGDVDGDGRPELIVAGGARTKSLVRVLDGVTGQSVRPDFNPFGDLKFVGGGVHVAAGDVNGDGKADIIVGVMVGPPILRTFDGVTEASIGLLSPAQNTKFRSGIRVAAVDVNGDGVAEIITATGRAARLKAQVERLDGTTFSVLDANPADDTLVFKGGAFVSAGR